MNSSNNVPSGLGSDLSIGSTVNATVTGKVGAAEPRYGDVVSA